MKPELRQELEDFIKTIKDAYGSSDNRVLRSEASKLRYRSLDDRKAGIEDSQKREEIVYQNYQTDEAKRDFKKKRGKGFEMGSGPST